MQTLRNKLIAIAVLAILAVVGSLMYSLKAIAQGPPDGLAVRIVQPLPVPTTGSASVSGNVGLVPGTSVGLVPGTSVGISGTVALAPATSVGVSGPVGLASGTSVSVNNPFSNPVPFRSVTDAVQPTGSNSSCAIASGYWNCEDGGYVVPSGKRLVIEYVSMWGCLPSGQAAMVRIANSGTSVAPVLPMTALTPITTGGHGDLCDPLQQQHLISIGQQLRVYADQGQTVQMRVDRNEQGAAAVFHFTLNGYLVDVP